MGNQQLGHSSTLREAQTIPLLAEDPRSEVGNSWNGYDPPTGRSDPYSNERSDEFWIVTRGHGTIIVDRNEVEIGPDVIAYFTTGELMFVTSGRDL